MNSYYNSKFDVASNYYFYNMKIYENDILIKDIVPAKTEDNKIVLYDRINSIVMLNIGNLSNFEIGDTVENVSVICKTDTYKMIYLLNDFSDTTNFVINTTNNIAKIRTSDGAEYTETTLHTWDKTKDKECSFGYKTRYVLVYFITSNVYMTSLNGGGLFNNNSFVQEIDSTAIYVIWKNLRINYNQTGSRTFFSNYLSLEYVKQIDSYFTTNNQGYVFNGCNNLVGTNLKFKNANSGYYRFFNCRNLREIEDIDYLNYINSGYMFSNCHSLKRIGNINMPLLTNPIKMFENCFSLEEIGSIDFSGVTTNVGDIFSNCSKLKKINNIIGLNISGYDFSTCYMLSHDTLIKILEALADCSTSETTYTLKLGSTNLAKLTEEEIAIGTNKGWTIS